MNDIIIQFFKNQIENRGIKYKFIAKKTGINYQRIIRIFNQKAIISGSEFICLCKVLNISQSDMLEIFNIVA